MLAPTIEIRKYRTLAVAVLLGWVLLALIFIRSAPSEPPPSIAVGRGLVRHAKYPPLPIASPPPSTFLEKESPVPTVPPTDLSPSPAPATPPSPTPETDLDPREKAQRLLEAQLRSLSSEADALDRAFAIYCAVCRPDYRSNRTGSMEREWYAVWGAGPDLAWNPGTPMSPEGVNNCEDGWTALQEFTERIAESLDRIEDEARAKKILPGHVRELLAARRLERWREYHRQR